MEFIDRHSEMQRLDDALARPGAFSVIWGRRRVGKSRLLIEWCGRHDGLYTVADQSAAPVQRRYLASAVARRFPGFSDVEYPTWRSFFARLTAEAERSSWTGPFVLDELPYLIVADKGLPSVLQNWLDQPERQLRVVMSGSSQRMMHGAVLDAGAPLYGRAVQAFAIRPLRAGYLADALEFDRPSELVEAYALWGGMPRYLELAAPFGKDREAAVDSLVLDPSGPLHHEPERLLHEELPPATSLRPLLDVIGAGAHRLSEIGARLSRPASSLSGPIASLVEMGIVRREVPFGSNPRSGKRSLYRIDDPFLRLWFRVVAPHRAALASSPPESRSVYWRRFRPALEAHAWEDLCRDAVPWLQSGEHPLARLGPFEPARRYWHGKEPERDVVARSIDGKRVLIGEAKLSVTSKNVSRILANFSGHPLPGAEDCEIVPALFVPEAGTLPQETENGYVVDAQAVLSALR